MYLCLAEIGSAPSRAGRAVYGTPGYTTKGVPSKCYQSHLRRNGAYPRSRPIEKGCSNTIVSWLGISAAREDVTGEGGLRERRRTVRTDRAGWQMGGKDRPVARPKAVRKENGSECAENTWLRISEGKEDELNLLGLSDLDAAPRPAS